MKFLSLTVNQKGRAFSIESITDIVEDSDGDTKIHFKDGDTLLIRQSDYSYSEIITLIRQTGAVVCE